MQATTPRSGITVEDNTAPEFIYVRRLQTWNVRTNGHWKLSSLKTHVARHLD